MDACKIIKSRNARRVIFVDADVRLLSLASEAAEAVGLAVSSVADVSLDRLTVGEGDIALIGLASGAELPASIAHLSATGGRIVACLCGDQAEAIRLLERYPTLNHVWAVNDYLSKSQLEISLAQLARSTRVATSDYLEPGTLIQTGTIADYGEKDRFVGEIGRYVAGFGSFADLPAVAATVAWELVANALFNAPRDPRGQPKYRDRERAAGLVVGRGEEVSLTYGHDGKTLAIAVEDRFGSLARATLVASLARASRAGSSQINMVTEGAGVGLYMVFASASQIDFRIDVGRSTEITVLINASKRYRDFQQSGTSINIFEQGD